MVDSIEMSMGMGTTGIPRIPRDSNGNESDAECTMGLGTETEIKAWELE